MPAIAPSALAAGPTVYDHLFVIVMMLVIPLHSWRAFPGLLDDIRKRGEPARVAAYRNVIITFALAACALLAIWIVFDRDWSALGLHAGEPGSQMLALGIAAVYIAIVALPLRNIALAAENGEGSASELTSQIGDLVLVMPSSRREESWFYGVSVNAGITEELIFRGFLIWYLQHFMGIVSAAAVAVLAFGFAHIYQGLRQLPGILLVSAVAVTTYLVSDSLVVPIMLHIVVDAVQGHYIARVLRAEPASA